MRSRLFTLLLGLTLSGAAAMNGLPSSALSAPALTPTTLSAFAGQSVYLLPEDGVLLVPPGCRTQACPLLTLSHTRGRTPLELLNSPSFQPFVRRLLAAKLPVLLSAEGGPDGWGGPEALWQLTRDHTLSRSVFKFSGRTYALGVSMGGMSALRAAVDAVFEVQGLILIDGRVNLKDAWLSGKSRKPELSAAYGLGGRPPAAHEDPLGSLPKSFRLPLLVFGSPQDETVNFARNGAALYAKAAGSGSSLIRTAGPHLGGSHLSPQVADQVVAFVQELQARK
ncbi:alpha/beta hydrolase [Deinococcus psychrotolerans]|uniref:Alpha/beta hydrolase n=2 Tax=Deinococcus TaxID=1298 RepID=A0A553V3T4_9DEIO|nr:MULTISPECIES: alpha/beta hydrolase [Deinococcus]AZI43509.1 alpha/beta hydrolase [Deinococcus psychrotolerans]TSA87158.1 alpha/beta hydrolase [Deinococcus detaillensis]